MSDKRPSVTPQPDIRSEIHPLRVAQRLVALREAANLGPSEFADSVEIDRSSYTKIEKGEKPLHQYMAHTIAVRYNVTMEFIYRGRTSDQDIPEKYASAIRMRLTGQSR